MMPEAAVIIPHYDDATRLARCLAALAPQVAAQAGRVQVVVVDNASPTSPAGVMPSDPAFRLVIEAGRGAALARNRGVAETTAPLLFFLDSDCLPAPDWLTTALAVAGQSDLVGGAVAVFDETPPPRNGAQGFEAVFAFDNRRYVEGKGFSVTANLLTRRDVFAAVGGFRPGMSEDLDWCHRARAAGYGLTYAPALRVGHPSRGDWPALRRKWQRLTAELFGLRPKGMAPRLAWAGRALVVAASILPHAPRVLRHPALRSDERLPTLATLCRLRLARAGWMLTQAVRGR